MSLPDKFELGARHLMTQTTPHEDDFYFFKYFDGEEGLFVDIGANVGHSAISFRLLNKTFKIHSFEPNMALEPGLAYIKTQFGDTYEYTMCGLGKKNEKRKLIIPKSGDIDLTHSASLDPHEFEKKWILERLAKDTEQHDGKYNLHEQDVVIRVFDDLGIIPTIVKIDVEGWEKEVLLGMKKTILQYRPIIMFEMNNMKDLIPLFKELDYHGFEYDHSKNQLTEFDRGKWDALNLFYFHPSTIAELKATKKEISWVYVT